MKLQGFRLHATSTSLPALDRACSRHRPSCADQQRLAAALASIEGRYPLSPAGVFVFVAYGIPYFNRIPGGMRGEVVQRYLPRLRSARNRLALEEAGASPTDVARRNPGIKKAAYNGPVAIEQ